jgi:hypothetical protein
MPYCCGTVVRWRRTDLRDELERRFGVVLHERSVVFDGAASRTRARLQVRFPARAGTGRSSRPSGALLS